MENVKAISAGNAATTRCRGAVSRSGSVRDGGPPHFHALVALRRAPEPVPGRGDYFLFEIAGESVIVIRGMGGVNAMMNVCRHRGSRICDQPTGHESRLVCRYHGWTYGLDGGLRAAGHMPEGFDRSQLGLRRHTRVFMGLIFVSFADEPRLSSRSSGISASRSGPMASTVRSRSPPELSDHLELEACDRKLLRVLSLRTGAPRILGSAWTGSPVGAAGRPCWRRSCSAPEVGLTQHTIRKSWLASGDLGVDRGFDRYPLLRGHLTGSRDGKPVAPLLGSITGYDGGTTDLHLGPTTFGLAYCDHVVLYRSRRARPRRGLRDHLAGQRVAREEARTTTRKLTCSGTSRRSRTRRSSSGTRPAWIPASCRGRSRRWKILPAVSCSGMPPSCVRRGRRTQIARPTNVVSRRTVLCPRGDRG